MSKGVLLSLVIGAVWLIWQRIQDLYFTTVEHKNEAKVATVDQKIATQADKIMSDKGVEEKAVKQYEND